jgi:hypothetical protein
VDVVVDKVLDVVDRVELVELNVDVVVDKVE